jgi:large subunit ribosomal protein L15
MPMLQRQPKLGGFRNPTRKEFEVVNIGDLDAHLEAGTYDVAALRAAKILRTSRPAKLLGDGALTKKFSLIVNAASRSARTAVEKAGGSVAIVHSA